jgi:hypothetical protein
MGFAKFLNERDDSLVAGAESDGGWDEKGVRQTLMVFAKFLSERDDSLVAGAESSSTREMTVSWLVQKVTGDGTRKASGRH